ncbi:four helix bundle protein [Pukyongia salina]|uniref:Four helix bundle protein n=1 Tax=Pukyongia salina TaxID=2094025 RepID=A0A2S0HV14_9FLAO|nr:four helix bundle protein [Pukyongia salina]AVI50509.1 four helix bundle protein [Pukyongia salina]
MAHFNSHTELEVYKLAREINKEVWNLIVTTPLGNDYKLRDQINGSSGSIMDNIAEGFGRGGNREFINFLSYSRGSCFETESQLQRAYDRDHISEEDFMAISRKTRDLSDQISRFINYLKSTPRKGSKFD